MGFGDEFCCSSRAAAALLPAPLPSWLRVPGLLSHDPRPSTSSNTGRGASIEAAGMFVGLVDDCEEADAVSLEAEGLVGALSVEGPMNVVAADAGAGAVEDAGLAAGGPPEPGESCAAGAAGASPGRISDAAGTCSERSTTGVFTSIRGAGSC